ncbi:MAG: phospho-sugar mutase [Actinomycetota bacterium]|nr:phospho-sugar mutase [Actinomycetota bacterium]
MPTYAADLLEAARAWVRSDPDPDTAAELTALVDAAAEAPDGPAAAELAERFSGRLAFGTAGLRGELGAGPRRMNRVVVTQAAAGVVAYLRDHPADGQRGVVIGFDARHDSDVFARDTAEVVAGARLPAYLLPRPLPTPVLAYAIRHLGCAAGVMVTASHNPPRDNGYKVYLGDGSQIVPPADAAIAAEIDAVAAHPLSSIPRSEEYETLGEEVLGSYVEAVAALPDPHGPRDLVIAHTSLHGVGTEVVRRVLERTGFGPAHEAPSQSEPDPDFPTVAFPNPEEPGAMDEVLATARQVDADLVVANDPDADRCAVAVPGPRGWQLLHGDQVGALLADHLLRRGVQGTYATTIVSSTLLRRLAAAHHQPYAEVLTGFKWIGRVPGLAYGYEEALGYAVAPHVAADKDGISALVRVCELAADLKSAGATLLDRLEELAVTHGLHATDQLSVRVTDLSLIAAAMARFRREPPRSLGGLAVVGVDDLAAGSAGLPPTDGLRFRLAEGARVVVRPSGTEPKLKCYLEVVVPVDATVLASAGQPHAVAAARISAAGRLDAIRGDLAAVIDAD